MLLFFYRTWSFAWQNFWRNLGLSLITILILVMTLISFDVALTVRGITTTAVKMVEQKVDVSLLFKPTAQPQRIEEIRGVLQKTPAVSSLTFKTPEEVLNEFKTLHAGNAEILSALNEVDKNPLGAAIVIQAKNTKDYEQILQVINIPEYDEIIESKTFDDQGPIIEKIGFITNRAQQASLILGALLTIVAFLIIFNVIRLGIQGYGEEIGIMKLVGASNWFVRLPFLLNVIFYCILAWLVNLGALYVSLYFVDPYLARFFAGTDFTLIGYFNKNFLMFFGAELVGLVALGVLSASLAMRRHLRI